MQPHRPNHTAGRLTPVTSKGLVRSEEYRAHLRKVNEKEMAAVALRIASQEHRDQIAKFQAKRAADKAKKDQAKL